MRARLASAALVGALFLIAAASEAPERRPTAEVRGIGLGLFATDPEYDYGQLVDEIESRGATDLLLVVQWSQSSTWSHDVGEGDHSASTSTIRRTIRQAHDAGLRVTVMPIVRLRERTPTQWRGNMRPNVGEWFGAYSQQLSSLTRIAAEERVERFIVGSELGSMQQHETHWRQLVAEVRRTYPGRLTYSANWDNFDEVPFWDALDEVGVTAYFPIDPAQPATSWAAPTRKLAELKARTGKPLYLTEVGYPSHRKAAQTPWDQTADNVAAPKLQAQLYRAFCDNIATGGTVDGFFFWNWFGFGGPREVSFTPRGKPAAAELERCLKR